MRVSAWSAICLPIPASVIITMNIIVKHRVARSCFQQTDLINVPSLSSRTGKVSGSPCGAAGTQTQRSHLRAQVAKPTIRWWCVEAYFVNTLVENNFISWWYVAAVCLLLFLGVKRGRVRFRGANNLIFSGCCYFLQEFSNLASSPGELRF